jgi:hypothetical protein
MSQKRSDVALVTSFNNGTLIELDDRPGVDMTARLLLALTALYVQRPTHTVEEQQQYIELAQRLIDRVEAATRAAVARILQRHPDAPAEVVERLGGGHSLSDGAQEDEPHSTPDRHPACHQHFASYPSSADWKCASTVTPSDAAAGRQPPPPLAGEGTEGAIGAKLSLDNAANSSPPPNRNRQQPISIGGREPTREGAFGEAFFAASPAERRRLLSLIACGCSDDVQAVPPDSERLQGKVDAAAWQGEIGEFTREFAQLIDIPNSLCERILNDPWGEPMVVAAKAACMPVAILQHILLLVSASASYSVERVYDLTDLYHELDGRAARDLLAQWRAQAESSDPISETNPNTADLKPHAPHAPPPFSPPHAGERRVRASLRSRFGALTGRLQAVNARPDRGSVARRGLRSR